MENQNISFILTKQANLIPNSPAIITDEIEITYKELNTYVSNISFYFLDQGIKSNDVVILSLDNELLLFISMLGLARIGAPFCTTPSSTSQSIIKELQDKIDAKFILLSKDTSITNSLKKIKVDFNNLNESRIINLCINNFSGLETLMYVKGSGTTGKSKIIPISHAEQLERVKLAQTWMPITKEDRVSSLLNLYYNAPKLLYFEALYYGAKIILLDKKSLLNTNLQIDILHSSVYYVENTIQHLTENIKNQFQNLKVLFLGGSTVSNILKSKIYSNLTKNLYIRYGTNEIGTICVTKYIKTDKEEELVGKPIGNTLVEIVDENDEKKQKGEIGFIRVKNLGMIKAYLDDEEATKKAFKNGWFYPGDLGKFTQDNQLIFCGRSDNMMIMNGNNIYPSQIESVVKSHFAIEDVVALPIKHPIHQDIPICAVVLKKDYQITKKELMHYCVEKLGFYSPKDIFFLNSIPKNEQGKIIKKELLDKIIQEINSIKESQI